MAFNTNFCLECVDVCDCNENNPAVVVEECPTCDKVESSEVCTVIFGCPDRDDPSKALNPIPGYQDSSTDEMINMTTVRDWFTAITNEAGGLKKFDVIGSKDASTPSTILLPKFKQCPRARIQTVSFTKNDTCQSERNWFIKQQSCNPNLRMWWVTAGCFLRGGEHGVSLQSLLLDEVGATGQESVVNWTGTASYDSLCEPPRDFLAVAP